jgi:hypothetical protein
MPILVVLDPVTKAVTRIECESIDAAAELCIRLFDQGHEVEKVQLPNGEEVSTADLTAAIYAARKRQQRTIGK